MSLPRITGSWFPFSLNTHDQALLQLFLMKQYSPQSLSCMPRIYPDTEHPSSVPLECWKQILPTPAIVWGPEQSCAMPAAKTVSKKCQSLPVNHFRLYLTSTCRLLVNLIPGPKTHCKPLSMSHLQEEDRTENPCVGGSNPPLPIFCINVSCQCQVSL